MLLSICPVLVLYCFYLAYSLYLCFITIVWAKWYCIVCCLWKISISRLWRARMKGWSTDLTTPNSQYAEITQILCYNGGQGLVLSTKARTTLSNWLDGQVNHSCMFPSLVREPLESIQQQQHTYWPSFLSSWMALALVSVMSLNEARKRTTSPFSFLIGTMSSRHQNSTAEREKHSY